MGVALEHIKNIFKDIGGWIYNKLTKNYYCETGKKYYVNISKFSRKGFIMGIAISPLMIPTAIIDGLARIFGSRFLIFSLFLEKIYLTIKMIFGEKESFNVNGAILVEGQGNITNQNNQNNPNNQDSQNIQQNQNNQNNQNIQQNQNNQHNEINLNGGQNGITQNNIEQDVSENQPNNPNLEEEQNPHIVDHTQNFLSAVGAAINDIRRFNSINLGTHNFSFTLNGNRDNEIMNNNNDNNIANIIRGNSMASSMDFSVSRSQNEIIIEMDNYGDFVNLKKILRRIIAELRREGYNPRIMEDMNDGNGERSVDLEELENVSVIKMLIPVNRNQNNQ